MNKREIVAVFRANLQEALLQRGLNQSQLSRSTGVDRSTLSQLLSADNLRMPRADTVTALARALQVSSDWLLGLSQDSRFGAEILRQSLEVAPHEPSPADDNLKRWYAEAAGLKIRYVPSHLPDLFKTDRVIEYEYGRCWSVRSAGPRNRSNITSRLSAARTMISRFACRDRRWKIFVAARVCGAISMPARGASRLMR